MTTNGHDDFDFVKASSPIGDGPNYGSMTTPSYDPDYRIENSTFVDPVEKQKQEESWREELEAIEKDIQALSTTLNTKIERANELKRNLGLIHNPLKDIQSSLQSGIQTIRDSNTYIRTSEQLGHINERVVQSSAYQKTNETFSRWNTKIHDSTAYQKTSAAAKTVQEKTSSALNTIGTSMSKKIGDIRNSSTFKSLEEKVETTYTSVKYSRSIENIRAKVRGSKSDNNLDLPEEGEETTSAENPDALQHEQIPL